MQQFKMWQQLFCSIYSPIQTLESYRGIDICVKRDDLNHGIVQGNKLRKLKYNLKHAIDNKFTTVATFGGAFSNHILATAKAAQLCGLKSIGFIRGDELKTQQKKWSKTLKSSQSYGMHLIFLNRKEYRLKHQSSYVSSYLGKAKSHIYLIPEGGSNQLAVNGMKEIIPELKAANIRPTHIICACGTGGSLAGLIDGVFEMAWVTKVLGIAVLKGANFLLDDIKSLSRHSGSISWQLYHGYHAGGYAKVSQKLLDFGHKFTKRNSILLDRVYNIKSFYAAYDLIDKGVIQANSTLLILHTGGLEGGVIDHSI